MSPDEQTSVEKEVSLLKGLITGDGEPEKGLIVRVARIHETQKIHGLIIMATFGTTLVQVLRTFFVS